MRDGLLFIRIYALICVGLALDCLRVSLSGGIPMPEWTHGKAIWIIPGEAWALASLLPPLAVAVWVGTEHRLIVASSAMLAGTVNLALGVFSADAEMGFIQSRVAFGAGLLWVAIAAAALADMVECSWTKRAQRVLDDIERRRR